MKRLRRLSPTGLAARRWARAATAAVVLASTLAVGSARPTLACLTVAGVTEEQHWAAADLVFTGTAVRVDDPTNGMSYSTGDPLYWTFAVDAVEKGDVLARITVASAIEESSCGYEFELGKRYRVYAADSSWYGHIATGMGDGNEPLPPLADPPPVEGEFHTFEYHVLQLGSVAVPAVPIVVLIGLGWWLVRRARR